MARLEFVADIAAPPDRVAAFFVPQRMPYWYGPEMELHFEVQGGAPDFQAGQKVRITGKLRRREVSHVAVVTLYEPGRALEWRFHDAYGVKGMQSWETEPVAGGTRVRMTDEYELPGRFGRIADALFMRFSVSARDRAWLRKLKQLAERV
jgi:hypothetical protein